MGGKLCADYSYSGETVLKAIFNYITVISVIFMITTVLLQARGSSLGAGFGGDTGYYHTKRGAEKVLYLSTIVAAVIFVLSVILSILAKR